MDNKGLGELYENAVEEWRIKRGIGTALIPNAVDDKIMILSILQRVYNKPNFGRTFIITNNFDERSRLVHYITHQEEEENNKEFKQLLDQKTIKIASQNLVEENLFTINGIFSLVILYHIETYSDIMMRVLEKGKFKLVIVNNLINNIDRNKVYKVCPLLNVFEQNEVMAVRLSTPVEEMLIDVPINEADVDTLKKYNDFIATSVNVFGDFKMLDKARVGDKENNISAEEVCRRVAYSNGWSETLDMSVEYNRQIDNLFNPISLADRAKITYDIIRARTEFLTNYKPKLEAVYDIVRNIMNKKILIINKKASFATEVRDYLNDKFGDTVCECFHDQLDEIELKDVNGNYVTYKSGKKAGLVRKAGAQLQCTMNMSAFNNGHINILSTGNSPDKKLAIDVDVVVITSPLCNEIESYLYRLDKVNFNNPIKLITLYTSNTLEQRKLQDRNLPVSHILLNNIKNSAAYDEINDVIVVD